MLRKIGRIILFATLYFVSLSLFSVIVFRFVPVPLTPLMILRSCEQISDGKDLKLKKDWVAFENMSPAASLAVMAAEDQKFEEHFGFDFKAIQKAEKYNERHKGKRLKGASTISQQTAKNVFLWPSRSWIRKGFEVYFTFLIELFWSKSRIMEVYLNVIEMGDGVYGIEAAAQTYFKKPASRLSVREAAAIAAILPNPRKWSPVNPNSATARKTGRIMHFMGQLDPLSENK